MAAKGKKYRWPGEKVARHTKPAKGQKTEKPAKPRKAKGGDFAAQLERRTTPESKRRLIQKVAGQRTTLGSCEQFLKRHKLRDPDLDDPAYFTRPQTLGQAQIEAGRLGSLRYGREEQALSQQADQVARQGRQIPQWFDQYRQNIGQAQAQAAAMAQPAIAQAQQTAQSVSQPVLAPNAGTSGAAQASPDVAERDRLAAASRGALAQSFASMLQANQASTSSYFAGRQGVARAAQIGAQGEQAMRARQLGQEKTRLAGERGDYEASKLAEARGAERQYGLERSAFGLDVQEAQSKKDLAEQAARDKKAEARRKRDASQHEANKKARADANKINPYGYSNKDWASFTPEKRRRIMKEVAAEGRAPKGGGGSSGGGGGGDGGMTGTQIREARRGGGRTRRSTGCTPFAACGTATPVSQRDPAATGSTRAPCSSSRASRRSSASAARRS